MGHLKYVLAKVEIAQMPKLQDYRDNILESLRRTYPIAQPTKFEEIAEFNQRDEKLEIVEKNPILSFQDIDNNWGFRVHPKAIYLHTRDYTDFPEFIGRLIDILEIVDSAIGITHYKFCGIRYVNKFPPKQDDSFSYAIKEESFIQPELDSSFKKAGSNHQAFYFIEPNLLKINGGVSVNGNILPPDLRDIASDLLDTNEQLEGPWAHLDIDSFYRPEKLQLFSTDSIKEIFISLRGNADKAFKLCTHYDN